MTSRFLKVILPVLALAIALLSPSLALAASDCPTNPSSSKAEVLNGIGESSNGDCSDSGVQNVISKAVSILSYVVGVVAIIAIINGGFKYITSGGDSTKVANAKSTLLYALIGIAVAVLAQVLVNFVLTTSNNALPGSCKSDSSKAASDPSCK